MSFVRWFTLSKAEQDRRMAEFWTVYFQEYPERGVMREMDALRKKYGTRSVRAKVAKRGTR